MLAIRLEKDLEQEIDLLAKSKGSNRSAVVREAIVRYLEDNEDLELAKQAFAETRRRQMMTLVHIALTRFCDKICHKFSIVLGLNVSSTRGVFIAYAEI